MHKNMQATVATCYPLVLPTSVIIKYGNELQAYTNMPGVHLHAEGPHRSQPGLESADDPGSKVRQ